MDNRYRYPRKYKDKDDSEKFVKRLLDQHNKYVRRNNRLSRLLNQLQSAVDNAARARNDLEDAIIDVNECIQVIREYNGED